MTVLQNLPIHIKLHVDGGQSYQSSRGANKVWRSGQVKFMEIHYFLSLHIKELLIFSSDHIEH